MNPLPLDVEKAMAIVATQAGGTWRRDRDGQFCVIPVGDFIVEAEPWRTNSSIGFDCALSHQTFASLINAIQGDPLDTFASLKWFQHHKDVQPGACVSDILLDILHEVIDGVGQISFQNLLAEFLDSPAGKTSIPQLRHLAALAWTGNFVQLMEYRETIGTRSNPFVPMVTREMVDRALDESLLRAA